MPQLWDLYSLCYDTGHTFVLSEVHPMETSDLNRILTLHQFFVDIARRDIPGAPVQHMWLRRIEKSEDERLILHICKPSDPTIQFRLGQCEQGENVFVTLDEDNEFSLRDSGWEVVSGINLPLPI